MRAIDNLVDEGNSFEEAKKLIKEQWIALSKMSKFENLSSDLSFLGTELNALVNGIHDKDLKLNFIKHYQKLLFYYYLDLLHRKHAKPYREDRLTKHREGGFYHLFGAIKILLRDSDLEKSNFKDLMDAWAEAEPLDDIEEDLPVGLVLYSPKDGADWVKNLKKHEAVNIKEIDAFVRKIRWQLSRGLLNSFMAGYQEFGGIVGLLMSLDFAKRGVFLLTKRFQPKEEVVFASKSFSNNLEN